MIKRLVVVQKSYVSYYPPLLTFLEVLKKLNIEVIMICGFENENFKSKLITLCSKVYFLDIPVGNSRIGKIYNWLTFRRKALNLIIKEKLSNETFYFATADTVLSLGQSVKKLKYILNLYELYDNIPYYFKNLKQYALSACKVSCPDRTRAHMFKVWWNLEQIPYVIPNRPKDRPNFESENVPEEVVKVVNKLAGSKYIIYQGLITRDRNLIPLCDAVQDLKDFKLVLMGRQTEYLTQLEERYPHIVHIPFVAPPFHLYITQMARLGILSYDYSSLNNIFCAPNKIWEYASIGLPMIGNEIPGLYNVVETYRLGYCVDFDNSNSFKDAIQAIDSNYEEFSKNSYHYFDSIDLEECVHNFIKSI